MNNLIRILTMVVVLGILVISFPAAPVLAASESVEIWDSSDDEIDEAEVGDRIYIHGEDFDASIDPDYYYVDIYFSDEEVDEGDDIGDDVENYSKMKSDVDVDEDGEFDTYFTIPDELDDGDEDVEVTGGDYYVYVTYLDEDEIVAMAEITIIAGEIELSPDEGAVGIEVDISGVDFGDDVEITVEFDGDEIDIEEGDDETDSDGEFDCTIIIPEATAGEHTITVTDDDGSSAEAEFTVEPEITLSASIASPGDSVTVYGTGFGDEVEFVIEFDGDEIEEDETDSEGSFQTTFTVPVMSAGSYEIEVKDDDKNKASVDFAISAGITLSPTGGNVGDTFTVNGTGFMPNSTVTIVMAAERTSVSSDSNGRFAATVTTPAIQSGAQTVTASDGSSTVKATYQVETTAPSTPATQSPVSGEKAKTKATFDWSDVTDPSQPLTYDLQIATDQSFTQIVLNKTMLTTSEYTLTEEEQLASTDQETPYYWRVRAVDGANNASNWTTPSSFYTGFDFGSIGWAVYLLVGIAVLLIGLIVYLVVLRSRQI